MSLTDNHKAAMDFVHPFQEALEKMQEVIRCGQVSCAQLIYIATELDRARVTARDIEMRREYVELCNRSIYPGLTLKEWRRRQELGRQIFETRKLKA